MPPSIEDSFTTQHVKTSQAGVQGSNYAPDNVDIGRQPVNVG